MQGLAESVEFASLGRFLADGGAILDRSLDPADAPIYALNSAFVRDGAVHRDPRQRAARTAAGNRERLCRRRAGPADAAPPDRDRRGRRRRPSCRALSGPPGVAYQTNVVTEVTIGEGADIRGSPRRRRAKQAIHLSMLLPRLAGDVKFDPFVFTVGGLVSRSEIASAFEAKARTWRCAALSSGAASSTSTRRWSSIMPRRTAPGQEYFKAAMDGQSHGVFQGKIIVRAGAQKTDSKMMSRALLLSEAAEFANKPELEIFADDVLCGHGATCGRIDEQMLFFLLARHPEARSRSRCW